MMEEFVRFELDCLWDIKQRRQQISSREKTLMKKLAYNKYKRSI